MTKRQQKILHMLRDAKGPDGTVTASSLAAELALTTKTIYKEIREITAALDPAAAELEMLPGKGYALRIRDEIAFQKYIADMAKETENSQLFSEKQNRIRYLIGRLIFLSKPILSDFLAGEVYISRSQLSLDVKAMKELLARYDLTLSSRSYYGLYISGSEENKRRCLMWEHIDCRKYLELPVSNERLMNTLLSVFREEEYRISDALFQNFLIYLSVMYARICFGETLGGTEAHGPEHPRETELARRLCGRLFSYGGLRANEHEVKYLADIIYNAQYSEAGQTVTEETNDMIARMLEQVRAGFGIDFTADAELRLSLALHITSLLERVEHHLFPDNPLLA